MKYYCYYKVHAQKTLVVQIADTIVLLPHIESALAPAFKEVALLKKSD